MGRGFFGNAFDFNHDGHLDAFEQAADFGMFMNMVEEEEKQSSVPSAADYSFNPSSLDPLNDSQDDVLAENGLDRTELEYMDEDERRSAIEDAGLDPDDFDFD